MDVYNPILTGYGIDILFINTLGYDKEDKFIIVDYISCINPKRHKSEIEKLQPYNIRYNKQLLIQILFYFYDKCLYYLIMTTEQQENLFTNYIEQGNPENEEGDVSLLVDLSEMINQYFIDKNILQLLKPFLSNARIIEGSTISSAKLSDSLAPLIEGFEEEEELGGGSGKMSKKNIRKSYYKKQTIKRNKKKHTSRKHKKGKKSKKTRKQ